MSMEISAYKQTLARMLEDGDLPLPSTVPIEQFRNAAIVAYTDNPDIAACTAQSIFRALRELAQVGLMPDGSEAALVPFRDTRTNQMVCTAMPMYQGLLKVVRNSGAVRSIWADVVYDNERLFLWIEDGDRRFDHQTASGGRLNAMARGGAISGAYAVARMANGAVEFTAMTREEIEKVRQSSRMAKGPAWTQWFSEMCKKTVLRRICKMLPMDPEDRTKVVSTTDETKMRDITPRGGGGSTQRGASPPPGGLDPTPMTQAGSSRGGDTVDRHAEPVKTEKSPEKAPTEAPTPTPAPESDGQDDTTGPAEDAADTVTEAGPTALPDEWQSVYDSISTLLGEAESPQGVIEVQQLFQDQLEIMREDFPDAFADLDNLAEERIGMMKDSDG